MPTPITVFTLLPLDLVNLLALALSSKHCSVTCVQILLKLKLSLGPQVLIRGELSAESEASDVLAVDDLSFSPGCSAPTGTAVVNYISVHVWRCFEIWPYLRGSTQTCFEY